MLTYEEEGVKVRNIAIQHLRNLIDTLELKNPDEIKTTQTPQGFSIEVVYNQEIQMVIDRRKSEES